MLSGLPQLWPTLESDIFRQDLPTPLYIYSEKILEELYEEFSKAFKNIPITAHFATKSNYNPHVLKFFLNKGLGIDVVSWGEMEHALECGFSPSQVLFSGVGKTNHELLFSLKSKVFLLNVESASELRRISAICKKHELMAPLSFRVNPDVSAETHPYISTGMYEHKFGVNFEEAQHLYLEASKDPHIQIRGISVHIGSQMLKASALQEALEKVLGFAERLKRLNISLDILDIGGGVGISYDNPQQLPPFHAFADVVRPIAESWKKLQGPQARLCCEPGRSLVGPAGFLITKVIAIKANSRKSFVICDAGMNDLIRPALYQARHSIVNLSAQHRSSSKGTLLKVFDVVGPVCESSDVLASAVPFSSVEEGDILAIMSAGAYGRTMSSHYNGRPLPAEWWLSFDGQKPQISLAQQEFNQNYLT